MTARFVSSMQHEKACIIQAEAALLSNCLVPTAYQAQQDDRVDSRHFQGRVAVDLRLNVTGGLPVSTFAWHAALLSFSAVPFLGVDFSSISGIQAGSGWRVSMVWIDRVDGVAASSLPPHHFSRHLFSIPQPPDTALTATSSSHSFLYGN